MGGGEQRLRPASGGRRSAPRASPRVVSGGPSRRPGEQDQDREGTGCARGRLRPAGGRRESRPPAGAVSARAGGAARMRGLLRLRPGEQHGKGCDGRGMALYDELGSILSASIL